MKKLYRQAMLGLKTLWTILWLLPQTIIVATWLIIELIKEDLEDFVHEEKRRKRE